MHNADFNSKDLLRYRTVRHAYNHIKDCPRVNKFVLFCFRLL